MPEKRAKRFRRHRRVRAKVKGTKEHPRLSVFRSNKHIYAQVIDDEKGKTLVAVSDLELKKVKSQKSKVKSTTKKSKLKEEKKEFLGKARIAYQVGQLVAKKAIDKKITKVVFDRGGYKYHGRVKAVAEGARNGGLQF